jgi:hypothetical protein
MTEEDRRRLGERRRMIFENVANGVNIDALKTTFRASPEEIQRETAFVARKITEYRFQRRLPPIQCSTLGEIRANRVILLASLSKIGPMTLSTELILPRLLVHDIRSASDFQEARHAVNSAR